MDTEANSLGERELLVKTLKRFSLTYEQNQMLHGSGIGLLAAKVAAKRKLFTIVLAVVAALLALQAVRCLFISRSYVAWAVCGAIFAFWCFKRHAKTRTLQRALATYAQLDSQQKELDDGLANELRLKFKLQYVEHQALHSGDPELAAQRIAQRCRENTRSSIKGAAFLSSLGLIWVAVSSYNDSSLVEAASVWFFITAIAIGCVIAIAISDKSRIRQVDRLLATHHNETQDNETPNTGQPDA